MIKLKFNLVISLLDCATILHFDVFYMCGVFAPIEITMVNLLTCYFHDYNNNNNNDRLTAFDPGQPG